MNWSDLPIHPRPRLLRQFAALWLVLWLAVAAWQEWGRERTAVAGICAALGLVVGLSGIWKPSRVRWLFVGWMLLVFPIGWTLSQVLLGLLFYGVVTPIGIILRWSGRDPLGLKCSRVSESFWTPKPPPGEVRRYFKQF